MSSVKLLLSQWMTSYAEKIVLNTLGKIQNGGLKLVLEYKPEAPALKFGTSPKDENENSIPTVVIYDSNLWKRLSSNMDLGFAEAYISQEVACDDIIGLLCLYIANRDTFSGGNIFFQLVPRIVHWVFKPDNKSSTSLINASFHYDSSNELFSSFLSPDMNYSSAIWSGEADESLESAQIRKVHNIIDKAQISETDHILDIGCGWGHLAMEAVRKTGCKVTGLTLSVEQKTLADERIQKAGLQDRIEIILSDYRSAPMPKGGYDRIVSVEMVEHVGREYMSKFFESISKLLKPKGGRVVVQGITIINPIHDNAPKTDTFIDRYVFPGGYLPTINYLLSSLHDGSNGALEVDTVQSIGPHYIRTLRCWRENFLSNWERIRQDFVQKRGSPTKEEIEGHRRRWLYYFYYCEAGFRARILGDHVIVAVRTPALELPPNVPL